MYRSSPNFTSSAMLTRNILTNNGYRKDCLYNIFRKSSIANFNPFLASDFKYISLYKLWNAEHEIDRGNTYVATV